MAKQDRCSKCGSEKLISDSNVRSYGDYGMQVGVVVTVDENPDASFFKGQHQGSLRAVICGACGYTELYAENAALLYEVYSRAGGER